MFTGQVLWAIVGLGVIILGIIMVYGQMKRRRTDQAAMQEEATREIYREERR